MSVNSDIEIEISKIKNLPPLPEESIKIITAVNNSDISIDELVETLSLSPVLVARLLGLANSAFFGRAGQINDLRIAVIQVLGLNLVKSLTLSIMLNVELNTTHCKQFDAEFFWSHSIATALIAQKLSTHIKDELMLPNIVYTSGLLLNVGLLASIYILPNELNEVFSKTDRLEGSVVNEMHSIVGMTQYEIGALLLDRWKLPYVYQAVLKQYRQDEAKGDEKCLVDLLELSHWVAAYVVTNQIDKMPDFSDLLNELSLSQDAFLKVVTDVVQNKDNINELASVISR